MAERRVQPINYLRIPLVLSAFAFLVFFPLILGLSATRYEASTGLSSDVFLGRWFGICATLFLISAIAYAVNLWRSRPPEAEAGTRTSRQLTLPDVILPVLDEAEALPGVLGAMPDGYRPIVVDNGSSDGSGRIAAELGALVVTEPRRGFGSACFAGLMAAEAETVAFMD